MSKISGIYKIQNLINNKIYIGSSKSVYHRWNQSHRPSLRKNKHNNNHLQNAWEKYGENNFLFSIVEECPESDLVAREEYWIEFYKSWDRNFGYNLTRIIEGRRIVSEETKKKIKKVWNEKYHHIYKKILELYSQGVSKNKIAQELKIKRDTVYSCLEYHGFHKSEGKGKIIKLTQETKQKIEELREQNMSWKDISKTTGVSHTQLFRTKINNGDYNTENNKRQKYKTMTPEVEKQAIHLRKQGKKWKDIATVLGVDLTLFYRHGIAQKYPDAVRKTMTEEKKKEIIKLRASGKQWKEICELTGCSLTSIQRHRLHK